MKRNILPYNPKSKELAKKLRSNITYSEVKLWNELKNGKSFETHPLPPRGGDASAQPLLFGDAFLNQKSLITRCSERSAFVNHPLPGGAKLMNDFAVNDPGWVCSIKRKVDCNCKLRK